MSAIVANIELTTYCDFKKKFDAFDGFFYIDGMKIGNSYFLKNNFSNLLLKKDRNDNIQTNIVYGDFWQSNIDTQWEETQVGYKLNIIGEFAFETEDLPTEIESNYNIEEIFISWAKSGDGPFEIAKTSKTKGEIYDVFIDHNFEGY